MASKRRLPGFAAILSFAFAAFVACTTSSRPPIDDTGPANPVLPKGSSSSPDAGVSCYGSDAACSDLSLCGEKVFVAEVAQTAPAPTGGTIVPGLYSMTQYVIYTGTGGGSQTLSNWFKETLEVFSPLGDGGAGDAGVDGAIDASADTGPGASLDAGDDSGAEASAPLEAGTGGGTFPWLDVSESDQSPLARGSGSIIVQGTSFVFQLECANAKTLAAEYTATGTTFVTYYDDSSIGRAAVTYTLMQ
jgi:hypothetical protein